MNRIVVRNTYDTCLSRDRSYLLVSESVMFIIVRMTTEIIKPFSMAVEVILL